MFTKRPHYRRFDRIELDVCWAGIDVLDIADKLTLLRELSTDIAVAGLQRPNDYNKVVTAVLSLHTAAEILGRSPTQYEYRRLRVEFPELNLVADGTLRRRLDGSWNECLQRALLPTVSDGDFVALAEGDRFSEEELVEAVRLYMAHHEDRVPAFSQLVAWTRAPKVRALPGRRPLSHGPFTRLGGYPRFLERNGFAAAGSRFDVRGRMLPLAWRFTDDELRAAVNQVAKQVGCPPREADYRDARERQRAQVAASNARPEQILPSVSTLKKRFGPNWSDVLGAGGHEAGAVTRKARLGNQRTPWTRQELDQQLKRAYDDLGEPFTTTAYETWRQHELHSGEGSRQLRIPSVATISREFGSWSEACDTCLPPSANRRRRRRTHGG